MEGIQGGTVTDSVPATETTVFCNINYCNKTLQNTWPESI